MKGKTVLYGVIPVFLYGLIKIFMDSRAAAEEDFYPRYGFFLCYVLAGALLAAGVYLSGQIHRTAAVLLSFGWVIVLIALYAGVLTGILPFDGILLPVVMNETFFLLVIGVYLMTGLLLLFQKEHRR